MAAVFVRFSARGARGEGAGRGRDGDTRARATSDDGALARAHERRCDALDVRWTNLTAGRRSTRGATESDRCDGQLTDDVRYR